MSDVNNIPEGSCPHCSPTPAEEPCCAPAEGSTGCGCRQGSAACVGKEV